MDRTQKKRRKHRWSHRSLRYIACLLIAAASVKVLGTAPVALAQETLASSAKEERSNIVLGMTFEPTGLDALLEAFQDREAALLKAEDQIRKRQEALKISEIIINEKLDELEAAEARLTATLAIADTAAEADLARLSAVYENMKPRDTAALFTQMAPGFAAGFLGLMRPESAAAIMTELEPDVAHLISVMLAGRNAKTLGDGG